MRIAITVKPHARKENVEKIGETEYRVAVREPVEEGRANEGVIRLLAEYFDEPRSTIRIVSGFAARKKIIEIG